MDRIVINGGRPLSGEILVSGAKNAALPLLASSLLAPGEHIFRNVPDLADVSTMLRVLRNMGCTAERLTGKHRRSCRVVVGNVHPEASYELVKTMRASVLVLGPLVARHGRARVSLPGGCAIGARPIDQHLKGLRALGAEIRIDGGYVEAKAKRLRGRTIAFDLVTVTGTENLMMAASLADGRTLLGSPRSRSWPEFSTRWALGLLARGPIPSPSKGSVSSNPWTMQSSPTGS